MFLHGPAESHSSLALVTTRPSHEDRLIGHLRALRESLMVGPAPGALQPVRAGLLPGTATAPTFTSSLDCCTA